MTSDAGSAAEAPLPNPDALEKSSSKTETTSSVESIGGEVEAHTDDDVDMEGKSEELPRKSGMKKLPNEILSQIFLEFDCEAPSSTKLKDQPTFDIISSTNTTLKNCSLVCTRWRQIIIPTLYKHISLIIPNPLLPKPMPILRNEHFPMLNFIRVHKLKPVIESFTLCVEDRKTNSVLHVDDEGFNGFRNFWAKILDQLDPLEVTIVCNPLTLGMLTHCNVNLTDAWSFDMPYHILHLSRPAIAPPPSPKIEASNRAGLGQPDAPPHTPIRPSPIFEARPWRTILLNEGSFIKAYKTYEFFQKQPPSILTDLLGTQLDDAGTEKRLLPSSVRDLSYVALFPTSQHFHQLAAHCPRLDRFYTQFVPRDDILQDPDIMSHLDPNDLWMERNSCYAFVMRELFSAPPSGNYTFLKEFESGDHADEDAWEMAVEYVRRAGRGWKIERRGVFVKDLEEAKRWEVRENEAHGNGGENTPPSLLSVPHLNPNDFDPDVI